MLSKEAKNLIKYYVSERKSLDTLTNAEYRHLVAENLRYNRFKSSILADADNDVLLPDLIADVIENYSETSAEMLVYTIIDIFLKGAFDLDFEECFNDEWSEQHPSVNEHFYHDSIERARAARMEY